MHHFCFYLKTSSVHHWCSAARSDGTKKAACTQCSSCKACLAHRPALLPPPGLGHRGKQPPSQPCYQLRLSTFLHTSFGAHPWCQPKQVGDVNGRSYSCQNENPQEL